MTRNVTVFTFEINKVSNSIQRNTFLIAKKIKWKIINVTIILDNADKTNDLRKNREYPQFFSQGGKYYQHRVIIQTFS